MAQPIHLQDLRKEYRTVGNTHVAVDNVNLDIPAGSFTTIVGPSGCGKTTMLRMIAGLASPTNGRVFFGDDDITERPPQERNATMVFQSIALYPHMTVNENIGYGLKINGVPETERNARIEEAAEVLQITEQLGKMPAELSGGQQQRVALGGAFVQDPDVLLLDEPMSDLDAKLKAELRVEVQRLHQEMDATVVYVTHDQTEAMTMSDYIVLLNEGRLAQFASPSELFDRPSSEYVARFIGTPATNIFGCVVETAEAGPVLAGYDFAISLPESFTDRIGESLRLGIRPQYLTPEGGDHRLVLTVEVVEQLGTEYVVHARADDDTSVDVVSTTVSGCEPDATLTVGFDAADAFLFDSDGEALLSGDELATASPTHSL